EALDEGPGKVIFGLHVDADANGVVTVSGTIPSVEEKVAISQRLRRVRGCNAVRNQLVIWHINDVGRSYVLVTAGGSHLVPADATEGPVRTTMTSKAPTVLPATVPATSKPLAAPASKPGPLANLLHKLAPSKPAPTT